MSTAPVQEHDSTHQSDSLQLVSFKLGDETFGIEITKIREIILVGEITRIPETATCVKGLINLRNTVIPVIDLRMRFSLPEAVLTSDSRIMVLQVGRRTIGVVVDSVNEVLRVARQDVSPTPPTVTSSGNEYMAGLVRLKDALLILLNMDRLLDDQPARALQEAAVDLRV